VRTKPVLYETKDEAEARYYEAEALVCTLASAL